MGSESPCLSHCSDSLLGSLCREADRQRLRCHSLAGALERCVDPRLRARLSAELVQLQHRRGELERLARAWHRRGGVDPLLLAFLTELSCRSVGRGVEEAL
jgi:hypothetical protein